MQPIALLPALLVLLVARFRSLPLAFVAVYLPALLLVPVTYRYKMQGLPDLGFHQSAILAVGMLLPFSREVLRWRFTWTDALVAGYAFAVAYSEYLAKGLKEAQNVVVDSLCTVVLPYAAAKLLIEPCRARIAFAKTYALLLFAVSALSLWEFRMGTNPFFNELWQFVFPGQSAPRTTYRLNFARITGPFTHAILAGTVIATGVFVQWWLQENRYWRNRLFAWMVTGGLVGGVVMSLSRGPAIGLVAGAAVAVFGYVRFRKAALLRVLLLAFVVVPPALGALEAYATISREHAETKLQANVIYRVQLLDVYEDTVLEKPTWGWGRNEWPPQTGMKSVDNHYLLLTLSHGLVTLSIFVALLVWQTGRIAWRAARLRSRSPATSLSYALLGAIGCIVVSVISVWMGAQTEPVLFLLLGWSEGLAVVTRPPELLPQPRYRMLS